jgi:hypothetical protein
MGKRNSITAKVEPAPLRYQGKVPKDLPKWKKGQERTKPR